MMLSEPSCKGREGSSRALETVYRSGEEAYRRAFICLGRFDILKVVFVRWVVFGFLERSVTRSWISSPSTCKYEGLGLARRGEHQHTEKLTTEEEGDGE